MNLKYIYRSLLVLLFTAALGGCNKWLELKPVDGIVGENYWKTKEQLSAAVTGIYASMIGLPDGVSDKLLSEYLFMWGELRADMVIPTGTASNDDNDIYNVNLLPTSTTVKWASVYRTINYCNTVIELGPGVLEQDPTLTQDQLNANLSEAYAIRALMYFYLARSFGDVPLQLKAVTSDDNVEQLAKSKQSEILDQVVADLTKAEPMAVTTYGTKAYDKGRVTKYTINAIQADVYLWMEKYTESVTACDKIINAGQFGLLSSGSMYYLFAGGGNSNEAIFEFQYDAQAQNPFYNLFSNTTRRYQVAPRVIDEIYTVDYVNEDSVDVRGYYAVQSNNNGIRKYAWDATSAASFNHWIIYRYADVLLMKAEALNQLDKGQDALDIVYQIRRRAHALEQTDLSPAPDDKDGVADFILEERAREFSFEGKRWYDLLRNAKRDNYRRLQAVLLTMVINTVSPDRQQSAINKYKDFNSHYFPIYYYELQTDKKLVQNPFYQ
ncbi:RagB/SusD family nutrient uptake outer membrane protein [Filimonas lacunae]|nr:RagB/SusD family nutrient uptake outer membrane protein [Filimonas lacunae]